MTAREPFRPRGLRPRPGPAYSPPAPAGVSQSRFDLWLVRAGYLAQVGLLVAAIFGFYYTVIPLYQKAAVDETLARRELELKDVEARLVVARREGYVLRRERLIEAEARRVADWCSEMRIAITQPDINVPAAVRHERNISIKTNAKTCLLAAATDVDGKHVLSAEDQRAFDVVVAGLAHTIEAKRLATIEKIARLPTTAAHDPSVLMPPGEYTQRVYAFEDYAARVLGKPLSDHDLDSRFKHSVSWTQERLASMYCEGTFHTILDAIRGIAWPEVVTATPK